MLVIASFTACERVDPDKEGILVKNWGQNYPDDYSVVTGKVNTWSPGVFLIEIPMAEQRFDSPQFQVYSSDGGTFTVDPEYSFSAIRGLGPQAVFKYMSYRNVSEFLSAIGENILEVRVRNRYKQIAGFYTTDSLMYNRVKFEKQVEDSLRLDFEEALFNLNAIASGLQPPASMQKAIDARNTAVQEAVQRENQLRAEEAQQKIAVSNARADVEVAKLQAEANRYRQSTLTNAILTEMAIQKWDGKLPQYNNGDLPFLIIK